MSLTRSSKLPISASSLTRAIRERYPHLSEHDAEIMANTMIEEIGKRVKSGEEIGFIRRNPDGTAELTVLGWELLG